jgi:hypothetical protein
MERVFEDEWRWWDSQYVNLIHCDNTILNVFNSIWNICIYMVFEYTGRWLIWMKKKYLKQGN